MSGCVDVDKTQFNDLKLLLSTRIQLSIDWEVNYFLIDRGGYMEREVTIWNPLIVSLPSLSRKKPTFSAPIIDLCPPIVLLTIGD